MVRDIQAQIMEVIMAPVQKVQDVATAIDNVVKGFPACKQNVNDHVNETMTTMQNELDDCKVTAFTQTHDLFDDCYTVINNFPAHTKGYISTFNKCMKHQKTTRCTNIHHIITATACATHATDNYQKQMREDFATANATLTAAPGRVPPILTQASECAVNATTKAYNSLTDTFNVVKKCAGITSFVV